MDHFSDILGEKQAFMDEEDAAQGSGADISSSSVLNVAPTTSVKKAGLYDKLNPAKAATAEGLYAGRKAAMKAADVRWGTQAYKDWDAKTRALMGVKKGDKFSSGQWMETFGGMSPSQINKAAGNVEYYLNDENLFGSNLAKRTVSSRAKSPRQDAIDRLNQVGFTHDVKNALTINGFPNIVIGEMNPNAAAMYSPNTDTITLGSNWNIDQLVHELGHRAVKQSGDLGILDKIQMPNVQALYEVGGNPFNNYQVKDVDGNLVNIGPHYGAQGEMVTSRAGTAQNLVDAMQFNKFGGSDPLGGGGWSEAYGIYNPEEGYFNRDYWDAVTRSPSKNRIAMSLSGPAAKAGWTANTPQEIGWYGATPMPGKVGSISGAARASPSYSVPGTGNVKAGYEQWLGLQNEMPSDIWGAAYTPRETVGFYADSLSEEQWDSSWESFKNDFKDGTFGPASKTENLGGGLWNAPMQGAHALVQEFMVRNKDMLKDAENNYNVKEALYNKFVAENVASPTSKISIMERLGLAREFWDKLSYMLNN